MPRVPRLLSGNKSKPLPLSPAESYLLSQIDGLLTDEDLALVAGMTPAQVTLTLNRLVQVGAIAIDGEAAPPPAAAPPPPRGGPLYDPAELDEPADLEPDKKRRVLELFYRLDDMSYYELLGVPAQAEKKQIKSAYYATAPEFHPDKYFRKNLGSFRQKIEAIFGRITLAHDTLTSQEKRAEYDEYVAQTSRNRATSSAMQQEETERELAAIEAAVQKAAAAALASQPRPAPAAAPAPSTQQYGARAPQPQPPPAARPPHPSVPGVAQDELLRQRKEALARKLMGGRKPGAAPPPASVPKGPPPEMDPEIAERAAEALRLRHEAAVAEAKRQQLQRYMENGKAALEKQDYAAAANAFRIASSLEPEDPKVQAICNEGLRVVAVALADGYLKQAIYEEGQERWAEAALSYSRVCAGRPDNGLAHERVAYATLRSSTNVRRAIDFARKAVEIEPRKAEFRITLARAYAAAGLDKSVQGELDRALDLAPKDPRIQQMVAAVRAAASAPKDGKVS